MDWFWNCPSLDKGVKKWKSFGTNRISEVRELSEPSLWKHCDRKINPTVTITRGFSGKQLVNSQKMWYGPKFLSLPKDHCLRVQIPATQVSNVSGERFWKAVTISYVVHTKNAHNIPILNLSMYSFLK